MTQTHQYLGCTAWEEKDWVGCVCVGGVRGNVQFCF